jgi:hypothetical protein
LRPSQTPLRLIANAAVEVLLAHVDNASLDSDAGVVVGEVEAPICPDRRVDEMSDLIGARDVAGDEPRASPGLLHEPGRLLPALSLGLEVGDDDRRTRPT